MGWAAFLGAKLRLVYLAYASYSTYQTHYDSFDQSYSQYSLSSDPLEKQTFKLDAQSNHQSMVDANDHMTLMLYAAGGVYVINILHAAILGPKRETASKSSIDFAFDPKLQQPQLRFSIVLTNNTILAIAVSFFFPEILTKITMIL